MGRVTFSERGSVGTAPAEHTVFAEIPAGNDANTAGVAWGAVIAGAFVAAALSLALLALGTGIGLSAISPWANASASATTISLASLIWLILMEIIASSMGGYLAGRLRVRWVRVHTHEVYFRDTAHGLLVWAVGLVITAAFLASAATSLVGGTVRASEMAAETSGPSAPGASQDGYFVDALLRQGSTSPTPGAGNVVATRSEVELILAHDLRNGSMVPGDRSYLSQLVASRTGMSQPDAEKRVDDVYVQAQQAADTARKAMAHAMYWTFLALLIGAFCASFGATIGGRQRDSVPAI
jgi:hypothetical protein